MASKKMVAIPGSKKDPYRDARAVAPSPSDADLCWHGGFCTQMKQNAAFRH